MHPTPHPEPRRRSPLPWRRLIPVTVVACILAATTAMTAASAAPRTIDWSNPDLSVSYPGGWTAHACGVEVPIICVERRGVAVGTLGLGAARVSSFDEPFDPNRPRLFLRAPIGDFIAGTVEQRTSVCAPDYEVHPIPIRNRNVLGERGISFGYTGNFAGEPTSELAIINLAVITDVDAWVLVVAAEAFDATACEINEGNFTVDDLRDFEPHLQRLVRHLPVPEFLLVGPES